MKEAVALQGFEEARHAKLIRVMIEKYGIDAAERPLEDVSDNVETRFKDFGFGECMDSFLGFGVFKIAMQSEFLPKDAPILIVDTEGIHGVIRQTLSRILPMAFDPSQAGI